MSDLLGITVEELVTTARARNARIPSEIGAFVALEVCEALQVGPASVRGSDVRIADDGTISVFAPPRSAGSDAAARSVAAMLGTLLVASGTNVPRVLVTLMEQGPSSGAWDLSSLRDDLEASLVPLNRAAARRVLSRMLRDVRRPRSVPASAHPPPNEDLDAQLDALLDAPPSSADPRRSEAASEGSGEADEDAAGVPRVDGLFWDAPPADAPSAEDPSGADALDAELDATLSELDGPSPIPSALDAPAPSTRPAPGAPDIAAPLSAMPLSSPARVSSVRATPMPPPSDDEATIEDAPSPAAGRRTRSDAPTEPPPPHDDSLDALLGRDLEPGKRGGALGWVVAFLALTAVTAAGLALLRPDLVDMALGRPPAPAPEPGPSDAERERMLREHRARFGTLTITASPPRAQVLMYVGRGPALATELPVGVAHEFVAVVDGHAPSRAVVPSSATWDEVDGRARYELAMQTGVEPMAELALGPTRLTADVGAPSGALGDVRVITNPPGAKVYVVVGFAPNATVDNVRTDEAVELLVYAEGHPVERLVVGPSDWEADAEGAKRASLSVALD